MPSAPPQDRFHLFGESLERLGASLERRLREAIGLVASDLEQVGQEEPNHRDRQAVYAVAAMLRIEVRARAASAAKALHDRAHKCLEYAGRADSEHRALALMEEDELRAQILAAELARAVRQSPDVDYERFALRVRALMPGLWQDDDLNPLGARTLASASLAAFENLGEVSAAELALRRSLRDRLPEAIATAVDEADRWLRGEGVEPESPEREGRRSERVPEERAPPAGLRERDAGWPEVEAPFGRRESDAREVPSAIGATEQAAGASRTLGVSPLSSQSEAPRLGVLPTLQPVVEIERDAVAFAHSIGAVPYSREARAGFFGNVRTRLRGAGVPAAQLATVDLVAAMFDYVVDDRRLPEAAKPLVWRLQQPAVALSLLDPAYLGDEPRSLRRLVENLGAIVNAFADEMTRGGELYRRLDTVVRAVEIVAGALQTRSAVMARQVEHEYTRAARNVTQLIERVAHERSSLEAAPGRRNRRDYRRRPDRSREQEVTEQLTRLLGERLAQYEVPDSVREFVLNVWLRHLRTAVLRDGEESSEFKVAMQVVDDLLWSLDHSKQRQSRRQLAQKIPPLIRLLAQGLREIGAKDEEFKPFFDELFLIHLRKMQRRARSADNGATLTAETGGSGFGPTTRTRTVTGVGAETSTLDRGAPSRAVAPEEPAASEDEGAERKLLEVLSSLQLDDLPASPRTLRLDPDQALATLRRGDWLRLQGRDGAPVHAKVAWINARRTVVLLVRHPDRRALSMRASELLERFAQGRAARVD